MSRRRDNRDRGFWGSLWDTLTSPFVLLFELLIALLSN